MNKVIVTLMLLIFAGAMNTGGQDNDRPVITAGNATQVELLAATGGDRIFDIEWSPDGKHIAVFSKNNMHIYDAMTLEIRLTLVNPCRGSQYPCRGTADFSEDGKILVVGSGNYVHTYDMTTFGPLAVYYTELDTSILIYDQRQQLLIHGGGPPNSELVALRNFDARKQATEQQPIDTWKWQAGYLCWFGTVSSAAISPDGRFLALSNNQLMVLERYKFESPSGTWLFDLQAILANTDEQNSSMCIENEHSHIPLEGTHEAIHRVVFSPSGTTLAAADVDGNIMLWSGENWSNVQTIEAHHAAVWDIAFRPDGQELASAGFDGTIRFWNLPDGTEQRVIETLGSAVTSVNFSPDGKQLAAGGWDGSLWLFDADTGELTASRPGRWWAAWNIAFNADGTRFALGNDNNEVVLFDVIDEPPFIIERKVFKRHQGPVYTVAFHPDGIHLASGGSDGMIYVWDMETGEITERVETEPRSAVYGLAYTPDGTQLACATFHGLAQVYSPYNSPPRCYTRDSDGRPVYSATYHGNLFASGDSIITNLANNTSLTLETWRSWSDSYKSKRSKLMFSEDGSALLNGGTTQPTYVWQLNDLVNGVTLPNGLMAISPDGSLAAGQALMIFDTLSGERLLPVEEPREYHPSSRDAVFSPNGRLIITAGVDGTLRVWGIPANNDE